MSAVTITYVFCDGKTPACEYPGNSLNPDAGPGETAGSQRRDAFATGWRYRNGKDHCGGCIDYLKRLA